MQTAQVSPSKDALSSVNSPCSNGGLVRKNSLRTISTYPPNELELQQQVDTAANGAQESMQDEEERGRFRRYWDAALKEFGCSEDVMMLKKKATEDGFAEADREEVVGWIKEQIVADHANMSAEEQSKFGSYPTGTLLELGAGIGRISFMLQPLCQKLVAVDFLQPCIEMNKKINTREERPLDEFMCADATKLEFAPGSLDVVFWNWLMMYLSDAEVTELIDRALTWLKPGGLLFCRESCGEPSDKNASKRAWATEGNPTMYRPAGFYSWLMTEFPESRGHKVEVIFKERPVSIYKIKVGTEGQQAWLIRKL
eukprot:GDKI01046330.1.p1 GENE.GDKI01046330.1~~GDKI01046330.1.p1  ORF type:complete len:338 (+),score=103.82 GDKI01046330.1:79-1014(+)